MAAHEWGVVIGALGAIAWVNWYFFVAGRSAAAATVAAPAAAGASGTARVDVVVRGGYSPSAIRVRAGEPVRLVFDRQETSSCSEEIVFPDFGIRRFLPAGEKTTIEITPPSAGRYEFMCGMSMLHGVVIAE
jgi:plastocyanin domain-containing protein